MHHSKDNKSKEKYVSKMVEIAFKVQITNLEERMICGQNIVKHSSLGLSRDPVVGRRNSSRQELLQVGKLIVARQIHGFDLLLLSAVQ